jgi:hypothetical protein
MILLNIGVLALVAGVAWWLSGYDSKLTGENNQGDSLRRCLRCGVTLFLVEVIILLPPTVIFIAVFLGVIWAGCLSEFAARGFHRLVDPEDKREFDPDKHVRQLDVVAALIRSGKKAEAIQLCELLKASGDADITALEMTLAHLGVPQAAGGKTSPLAAASRLRQEGKFEEAGLVLDSLLAENPRNADAAMMLVRLYAQNLRQPGRAQEVLRALEQQPDIPASHIEFARRSIDEWSRPKPEEAAATAPPESVGELLAQGFFGTAIEMLENKIKEQPVDFELRLKLAEVHAVHCNNFQRAEKIISQLETDANFSPPQVESARAKLKEWREARPARAA